jgi:hypothetical protein
MVWYRMASAMAVSPFLRAPTESGNDQAPAREVVS